MTAFNADITACYSDMGTNWLFVCAVNMVRTVGMRLEFVGLESAFQSEKTGSTPVGTAICLNCIVNSVRSGGGRQNPPARCETFVQSLVLLSSGIASPAIFLRRAALV